jgi:multidrug efflux pump subunit AcrA (membrane-fusion protein)
VASQSRIDDAENGFHIAEASLLEARARLERATRDLARTELKAPYRGRVRSKKVDVGQFVTRGSAIATLYAVDFAEIRLPVPDRELAFLDVPLVPRGLFASSDGGQDATDANQGGSPVSLSAEFAGRLHHWNGTLVRTEAELDPRTRMVHLVARVADPYGLAPRGHGTGGASDGSSEMAEVGLTDGLQASSDRGPTAPLAVGLFVKAIIQGRTIERAFVIPRDALREGNLVYVVDSEQRIQFRHIEVMRTERENIIVTAGLESGERVCITPLQAAINGMRVRVYESGNDDGGNESANASLHPSSEHPGLAERPDAPDVTIQ